MQVAESAGSECADAVRATTAALEEAYDANATATKALFNVDEDGLRADFWYMVADSAAMAVNRQQGVAVQPLGEAGEDLVTTFATVTNDVWGDSFGSDCFYDSNCLRGRLVGSVAAHGALVAVAKCFQLYFQVAPEEGSLRAPASTWYHLDQCDNGAGTTDPKLPAAWNAKMGGDKPQEENTFRQRLRRPLAAGEHFALDSDSETEPAVLAVCDSCGHCGDLRAEQQPAREPDGSRRPSQLRSQMAQPPQQ